MVVPIIRWERLLQSRHTMRNCECRFSEKTAAQVLSGYGEWCNPRAVLMLRYSSHSRIECGLIRNSGSITLVQPMNSWRRLPLDG
jgi:hypothetical protein